MPRVQAIVVRDGHVLMAVARECTGMTLKEIGQAAGGMDYAAVRMGCNQRQREH